MRHIYAPINNCINKYIYLFIKTHVNNITSIVHCHWEYDNKECSKENSGCILDKYIFINAVRNWYKLHASVAGFLRISAFTHRSDK